MLISILIAAVSVIALFFVLLKTGIVEKVLVKLGLADPKKKMNWTAFSWESSLRQSGYKADVCFFGDSLIRGGEFQKAFPHTTIVNFGCSGDTICNMRGRLTMIQAVEPRSVFLMAGINGLTNWNVARCVKQYKLLISELQDIVPNAQIYLHSVLPISKRYEKRICKNETILRFNQEIEAIAREKGITFINLHPLYSCNGELDPAFTVEGLHLRSEAYQPWIQEISPYLQPLECKKD